MIQDDLLHAILEVSHHDERVVEIRATRAWATELFAQYRGWLDPETVWGIPIVIDERVQTFALVTQPRFPDDPALD